jgi:hypothetical protein
MKTKTFALSLLILAAGWSPINAAPIVELLFNDPGNTETANLGSLGGTTYLPTGGAKGISTGFAGDPPFDTGTSWQQTSGGSVAAASTYSIASMSAFSFSFWVLEIGNGSFQQIFSARDSSNNAAFGGFLNASNQIQLLGPGGTSYLTLTTPIVAASPFAWTFVAVSYDSAGATTAYVNGVSVAFTGNWSGSSILADDGLRVGVSGDSAPLFGYVDNIQVFDSALTSGDVTSLMNTNAVPEPATVGLLLLGGVFCLMKQARARRCRFVG